MSAITAILNVHREGILAHASLRSLLDARDVAETAGIAVDVLVVADRADEATLEVVNAAERVEIMEVDLGDLGLARNAGVAASRGQFLAFLDADDLWSRNWLVAAHAAAMREASPTVWHPEASLLFGPQQAPTWLLHPDIESADGDWVLLGMRNHWTSLSFARSEIYRQVPYRPNDLAGGFGYEDWCWNAETVAQGCRHKPVLGTTHLVRMRASSLMQRSLALDTLATPSSLFRRRIGWAASVGTTGIASAPSTVYERGLPAIETT